MLKKSYSLVCGMISVLNIKHRLKYIKKYKHLRKTKVSDINRGHSVWIELKFEKWWRKKGDFQEAKISAMMA